MTILAWIVLGLVAGAIAKALMSGRDPRVHVRSPLWDALDSGMLLVLADAFVLITFAATSVYAAVWVNPWLAPAVLGILVPYRALLGRYFGLKATPKRRRAA